MNEVILYDYWWSSASYRVRIALCLLGIPYRTEPIDLVAGMHKSPEFRERNPQGLVPALQIDGVLLTQSLAIIEYLDETQKEAGFLPKDAVGRQHVRALSHVIAMDIHPVCNLGVVGNVMKMAEAHGDDPTEIRLAWMRKYIAEGLYAFERLLDPANSGGFCHGDRPSMADICLIPQVFNAKRWGVDIGGLNAVNRIAERCLAMDAFARAHPDLCPH
ncbi:maleylacetoacetate isomerase [Thalassospira alkalitolerans]|uniref:maleylacetoacetate isomerase n=1 Tax=Thalassospira alkalitolerans TaxID=1293890 RepID=UPI003AA815E2